MPLASVSRAPVAPEDVRTPFVAEAALAGKPMKSVPPAERVIAPRLSRRAFPPEEVRTMSEAPVPMVVLATAWELTAAAAVRSRRPLPLPTSASWTSESCVPICGAEAPPKRRAVVVGRILRILPGSVVPKVNCSVLILLGEPPVTPGAPAMMVVEPV